MKILHIASINDNPCAGVPVAVPQHLRAQQEHAEIAFLNLKPYVVDGIEKCYILDSDCDLKKMLSDLVKPDLVVFHEVYYIGFIKLYIELKRQGIPYIIIPHGSLTMEAQNKKRLKKIVGNFLLFSNFIKGALAIQYLSEKESASSKFGKRRIIEPNGILMPKIKKQYYNKTKEIRLVYIGNLQIKIKGLDLMLEAIKQNEELLTKRNVRIDLYGPNFSTRHEDILDLITALGLEKLVFLHDSVTDDEKTKALLNSDVFIQTSRSEGLPMGILEALSYGIPCIVTQGTNLKEIIEESDAGWGADNTSDSIGSAIKHFILNQDELQQKSENAIRLIKERFEWSVVANRTISKYLELLG